MWLTRQLALILCFVLLAGSALQAERIIRGGPHPKPGDGGGDGHERPTLDQVIERCVKHVTALADRCVKHNGEVEEKTIAKIKELLAAGNEAQARRLARGAINGINHSSRGCIHAIVRHCGVCVKILEKVGGTPEQVEKLKTLCREQAERVEGSRATAVSMIEQALPPAPPKG
jgi:hypothetical protein